MKFLTHCEDCQRDSESETERSWCSTCGSTNLVNTKLTTEAAQFSNGEKQYGSS